MAGSILVYARTAADQEGFLIGQTLVTPSGVGKMTESRTSGSLDQDLGNYHQ